MPHSWHVQIKNKTVGVKGNSAKIAAYRGINLVMGAKKGERGEVIELRLVRLD